jgi:hypothetical protein
MVPAAYGSCAALSPGALAEKQDAVETVKVDGTSHHMKIDSSSGKVISDDTDK